MMYVNRDMAGASGQPAEELCLMADEQSSVDDAAPLADPIAYRSPDAKYRCLFDNNLEAVFSLDRDGRFTEANPVAERLSGYSKLELRAMNFAELCALEDRHKAMFFFARAMSGGSRGVEVSAVCRDGSCVDLYITVAAILTDGAVSGLFCTARDITRKRRAEVQLRRARRDAELAKDRFLSVLSHELRTPLMPVLTTVQMLEKQAGLPVELQETLGMMRRNLELEARLIDDLLDLNRIRQGKLTLCFENVDMHAKIHHVLELCRPEIAEKQLSVEVDLQATGGYLAADASRLIQVLWNMVSNAVKFTPAGGSIKMVTCNGTRTSACTTDCGAGKPMCKGCKSMGRNRQFIAVHVTDTGVGITEDSMRHLFDAFGSDNSTSRHGSGRGISLSISKSLVELHGGHLVVHSNGTGEGATFSVILPVRTLPADGANLGLPQRQVIAPAAGKKVLLVEDHSDTAKALSRLLRSSGFAVEIAESVEEARGLADALQFDLLISDIGLPDGTGLDVARYVRQRRAIPAIALSGYGMEEDVNRSREAGFAEHLVKPINITQLQETIRRLLASAS